MILQIRVDSKCLRKKTKSLLVKPLSNEKLKLISDMKDTLSNTNGVGLAAPQVGSHSRIFIISYGDFEQTFINPIIRATYGNVVGVESCLSVPNRAVKVNRSERIEIEFYDETGSPNTGIFEGFIARIVQHEYDHLEGKLIIDYL